MPSRCLSPTSSLPPCFLGSRVAHFLISTSVHVFGGRFIAFHLRFNPSCSTAVLMFQEGSGSSISSAKINVGRKASSLPCTTSLGSIPVTGKGSFSLQDSSFKRKTTCRFRSPVYTSFWLKKLAFNSSRMSCAVSRSAHFLFWNTSAPLAKSRPCVSRRSLLNPNFKSTD